MCEIVKRLEDKTINTLCLNLHLYAKLCEKFGWKIPLLIGNKIMMNIRKQRFLLNEEKMKFFSINFIEFNYFPGGKQFFRISNFEILHGRHLETLNFYGIKNLSYNYENFSPIYADNLFINNIKIMDFDFIKMKIFFKNYLFVKHKISIENMKDKNFFRALLYVFKNSTKTLMHISFKECKLYKSFQRRLALILSNCSTLKSVVFDYDDLLTNTLIVSSLLLNTFSSSGYTLKVLNIEYYDCNTTNLVETLNNLYCLEEFSAKNVTGGELSLIRVLKKNHSSTLTNISLVFDKLSSECLIELGEFFSQIKNLRNVYLLIASSPEPELENIFRGLENRAENLQKFYIGLHLARLDISKRLIRRWKYFLLKCKSLQELNLLCMKEISNLIPWLKQTIYNCKSTLETVCLYNIESKYLNYFLPVVKEVENLRNFNFDCYLTEKSSKVLIEIIEHHRLKLESLSITDKISLMNRELEQKLAKTIASCKNLKNFSVFINAFEDFDQDIPHFINPSCQFLENLEELSVGGSSFDFPIKSRFWKAIKKCQNLKVLSLWPSYIEYDKLKYLFNCVKPAKFTLEELHRPVGHDLYDHKDIKRLAKRFYCVVQS